MAKRNELTDDEILARISDEENAGYGINDSQLAGERAYAIDRYLGRLYGNEVEGRSQVVSTDVTDAVDQIHQQLVKIFMSGDEIVRFDPTGPDDIEAAVQETDVINHVCLQENNGFLSLYTAMKDALISKNGYLKVFWEEQEEVEREFYKGLTDDEFALIAQDSEVEIIEHDQYPDEFSAQQLQQQIEQLTQQFQQAQMAAMQNPQAGQQAAQLGQQLQQLSSTPIPQKHDVRVQTKESRGEICIKACAPESMIVSYTTDSVLLGDSRFVQHREWTSISELEEQGFNVPEDVGLENGDLYESEQQARNSFNETNLHGSNIDGKDRMVLAKDTYMMVNGELMRYVVVGNQIIHKEEAEIIPFVSLSPILMPHRHVGRSIADLVNEIALIKTTVQRGQLDGMYLALNPRTIVNERVNLDDLLVSRPGGVIRTTGAVNDSAMPLPTPDVSNIGYPMLQYLDSVKTERTGISPQMQTVDANAINKTATQANILQNNAMERVTMIARVMAETGFKELFRLVHRLMRTHSDREKAVRIRNQWVTVDPRVWRNRYQMSISVGLGTSNKDQQLGHLNNLWTIAMQAMQAGIQLASPKGLYEIVSKLTVNAGFKNPEEFWQDPTTVPPQPPQPNPLIQVEQIKQQGKQQELQIHAQLEQQKAQANLQQEQLRSQNDVAIEQSKIQAQMELERWKAELEAQTTLQKAQIDAEAKIAIEQYKAANAQPAASVSVNNDPKGEFANGLQVLMEQQQQNMQMLAEVLSRPKSIVRGPDGRAIGVQ